MKVLRFPRLRTQDVKSGATLKVMEKLLEKMNKKSKDDTAGVSLLSESVFSSPKVFIPSGIVPLDCMVCYGLGFPVGIIEIYGPEASGKSAILEFTLAESQRRGYFTGLFPMEYSFDMERAMSVGIEPKRLFVFDECETIEDIYETIKKKVRIIRKEDKHTPIVFGWDTIAATPTRTELDNPKGLEASDMGKFAAQFSKLFRRMVKFLQNNTVCLICINQTRTNIAQMWGNKETTFGGKALKFYAWVRIRVRQSKKIEHGDEVVGIECEMMTTKNKVAPPFREAMLPIYWEGGIDNPKGVWAYATENSIFELRKNNYRFNGDLVTKGAFRKFYRRHKDEIDTACKLYSQGRWKFGE